MYCTHCGKEIDEGKLERKKLSQALAGEEADLNVATEVEYVCPRCSHRIHHHVNEQEIKTLAAASHAEIQRGRNFFASGMSLNLVGLICLILGVAFFLLAKKPANNYVLVKSSAEFIVSVSFFLGSAALLIIGIVFTALGLMKKRRYEKLLHLIQTGTFAQ